MTSSMKSPCRKRSLPVCTSSSLKMPTSKHAWTSSKTIWSTRKPKSSKPQVEGRTSSKSSLRGNWDSSEYFVVALCLMLQHKQKRRDFSGIFWMTKLSRQLASPHPVTVFFARKAISWLLPANQIETQNKFDPLYFI